MKITSPISLLLFLRLTSALPLRLHLSPNTPPTKLNQPHFPTHQLSSTLEIYDNRPLTPPSHLPPTISLNAPRPLTSSYLLQLSPQEIDTSPSPIPTTTNSLPSKPTSALPSLRKEDARRYWASENIVVVPVCGDAYLKIQGAYLNREYSDLMVVGIVVLFLAVVVGMETVERVGDLKDILCGNSRKRGEIYLEDDEVRKPFYLQPAPPRRCSSKSHPPNTREDEDTVVGEFVYDSDAAEKV